VVLNHEGPPSVKPKFSPRNKSLGCRGKRNRLREPRVWLALWRTARRGPGPVPTTSPLPTTHQAPPKSRKRRTRSRRPSSHPTNRCRANTRSRLAHHRGESRCVNRWRCSRARCPRRTARPPLLGQSGSWEGTCDGWGVRSVMMRWVRSARRRGETTWLGTKRVGGLFNKPMSGRTATPAAMVLHELVWTRHGVFFASSPETRRPAVSVSGAAIETSAARCDERTLLEVTNQCSERKCVLVEQTSFCQIQ
jgi:hypothetical protein